MGWIFFKPTYERMPLIDHRDLDSDPGTRVSFVLHIPGADTHSVVRFQHKYYGWILLYFFAGSTEDCYLAVLLALFLGFGVPPLLGFLWDDAYGAFIWGGLVARVASGWLWNI
jgi:stearoyl-CoA desaturase (delta-9 desaturase)